MIELFLNEDFNHLQNVEYISLDFYKIKLIRKKVFNATKNIVNILIQSNRLVEEDDDDEAFIGLAKLRNLWLNCNKLKQVNSLLMNDFVLDKLDLSANELTEFNAYNSNNITHLDLSANKINSLFFSIRNTKLKSLNLSNNRLNEIYEDNLKNLTSLTQVN